MPWLPAPGVRATVAASTMGDTGAKGKPGAGAAVGFPFTRAGSMAGRSARAIFCSDVVYRWDDWACWVRCRRRLRALGLPPEILRSSLATDMSEVVRVGEPPRSAAGKWPPIPVATCKGVAMVGAASCAGRPVKVGPLLPPLMPLLVEGGDSNSPPVICPARCPGALGGASDQGMWEMELGAPAAGVGTSTTGLPTPGLKAAAAAVVGSSPTSSSAPLPSGVGGCSLSCSDTWLCVCSISPPLCSIFPPRGEVQSAKTA